MVLCEFDVRKTTQFEWKERDAIKTCQHREIKKLFILTVDSAEEAREANKTRRTNLKRNIFLRCQS